MNHRVSVRKLSKTPSHRKAMMRNMVVSLFRHEQIKTTIAKAKVLRRFSEKLISCARTDGVHNRRMAGRWVQDKAVLNKLFTEIGPRYIKRAGGYTRIVRIGPRNGDASEMAYIGLIPEAIEEDKTITKRSKSKKTDKLKKAKQNKEIKTEQNNTKETKIQVESSNDDAKTSLADADADTNASAKSVSN